MNKILIPAIYTAIGVILAIIINEILDLHWFIGIFVIAGLGYGGYTIGDQSVVAVEEIYWVFRDFGGKLEWITSRGWTHFFLGFINNKQLRFRKGNINCTIEFQTEHQEPGSKAPIGEFDYSADVSAIFTFRIGQSEKIYTYSEAESRVIETKRSGSKDMERMVQGFYTENQSEFIEEEVTSKPGFIKVIEANIINTFQLIAMSRGYEYMKLHGDWTLQEILTVGKMAQIEQIQRMKTPGNTNATAIALLQDFNLDSLQEDLDRYFIELVSISISIDYEEDYKKVIKDQKITVQENKIKIANAIADADANIEKARGESALIREKGKAEAYAEAEKVSQVGKATNKAFTSAAETIRNTAKSATDTQIIQNAKILTPGAIDKEIDINIGTPSGNSPKGALVSLENSKMQDALKGMGLKDLSQEFNSQVSKSIQSLDQAAIARLTDILKNKGQSEIQEMLKDIFLGNFK